MISSLSYHSFITYYPLVVLVIGIYSMIDCGARISPSNLVFTHTYMLRAILKWRSHIDEKQTLGSKSTAFQQNKEDQRYENFADILLEAL